MPYQKPTQKSLDNLKKGKRFKKGQSGNPKGRPKEIPELKELLADVLSEERDGMSAAKGIILSLRNEAMKGNVRAAELLLDRGYGKVKQDIGLSGEITEVVIKRKA